MNREDWNTVEQALKAQFNPVHLDCDGYLVRLMLERASDMKLGITVYVDGWFRGAWLLRDKDTGEWPEIARRFLQLRERRLWPIARAKKLERTLGKRRAADLGVHKKAQYRNAHWTSVRSLRRHFERENESIRLLSQDEYDQRLASHRDMQAVADVIEEVTR